MATTIGPGEAPGDVEILIADVKRAHFYAKAIRRVFVEMPVEDNRAGNPAECAELKQSLYGTQDAAHNWDNEYSGTMEANGYRRGAASPCQFYNPSNGVRVVVHGDDFVGVGSRAGLDELEATLRAAYECVVQRLGWRDGRLRQARILGRILTLHEGGADLEADPVLIETAVAAYGLESSKETATPAAKDSSEDGVNKVELLRRRLAGDKGDQESEPMQPSPQLSPSEATKYLSTGALLNYIAQDRPDIQWAVKEVLRKSSNPSQEDEVRLKRVCRYLKGIPRAVIRFEWQERPSRLTVLVDADFAGCKQTRKSCTGGAAMWGRHCLKSWAKTLPVIALSTGEAELGAVVKGATEGLGLQAGLQDMGVDAGIQLKSDATAAIGIVSRLGLGKVRHLAVADLWVQQCIRSGKIACCKVPGPENASDAMTKALDGPLLWQHMHAIGLRKLSGRAEAAPQSSNFKSKKAA